MQTTANIWDALCKDLETQRASLGQDQHHIAAKKFKEAAVQVFRSNSSRLCDAIEIAGDVCQAAGYLDDAAMHFREGATTAASMGSKESAARMSAKLAILYDTNGQSAEAREAYEQALGLFEKVPDYSQHVMLLTSLGGLCRRIADYNGAEKIYLRAIDMATQLHGKNNPEVAAVSNNLGVAYTEAGDYVKAENMHLQALSIREKTYGAMHPEMAQSLGNLAVVYHSLGDVKKAEAFYKGALKTYAAFRKSDDPEVKSVQENFNRLRQKQTRK